MLTVVRMDLQTLAAWCATRRSDAAPPLIVTVDHSLEDVRRALGPARAAFIVDVTGHPAAVLVGDAGARLPGPDAIPCLEPFLRQARASPGFLEVVLLDQRGRVDDRFLHGSLDPVTPVRRPWRSAGSRSPRRTWGASRPCSMPP